jgi:hypothetical protein
MTEAQWEATTDPSRMLELLRPLASDRKLRLLACACIRRIWHLLSDEAARRKVELSEEYADNQLDFVKLLAVGGNSDSGPACSAAALVVEPHLWVSHGCERACSSAAEAVALAQGTAARKRELAVQAELARCVFGNPGWRLSIPEAWRRWGDGTLARLAQAAYEERQLPAGTLDNARLAVLADALEEAGCCEAVPLRHLRFGGTHVRGCFVLDALLGLI